MLDVANLDAIRKTGPILPNVRRLGTLRRTQLLDSPLKPRFQPYRASPPIAIAEDLHLTGEVCRNGQVYRSMHVLQSDR